MEKKILAEKLRLLNEKYMKIFEEYVSSGYIDSIAKVLCYLPKETSVKKLDEFPEEFRKKILERMKKFEEDYDAKNLQVLQILQVYDVDVENEMKEIVKYLNHFPLSIANEVLDETLESNPVLLNALKDFGLRITDLLRFSDKDIQKILYAVEMKDMAIVLKYADEDLRKKITCNMTKRGAQMLLEDIESMGPFTAAERKTAEENILSKVEFLLYTVGSISLTE